MFASNYITDSRKIEWPSGLRDSIGIKRSPVRIPVEASENAKVKKFKFNVANQINRKEKLKEIENRTREQVII